MSRARILVVDDDKLILKLVEDALTSDGFAVATALSSPEGIAVALQGKVDLVIADVNLPGNDGFAFREDLRKLSGFESVPFVFVTAADKKVEMQIAQKLGGDLLVLKPATGGDIRRAVYVGLRIARVEKGDLPDALPTILGRIADDHETGILTVLSGTNVKRVVLQDGKVAFAASNDPREVIGQVFVRAGLISEKDLAEAFAWRDAHAEKGKRPPLGAVLTALRKVTPEQCEKVFHRKVKETILDAFLWKTGVAEFVGGGVDAADRPFPIALDTHELVREGTKRRGRWTEVQRILPDPTVRFDKKGGAWPKGFPANDGDRVLAKHVDAKRSMAEILVELRGQDFAVGVKLADLVKKGVLVPVASQGFSGATFHDSVTIDIDEVLNTLEEEERLPTDHVEVAPTGPVGAVSASASTRVLSGGDTPAEIIDLAVEPLMELEPEPLDESPPVPLTAVASMAASSTAPAPAPAAPAPAPSPSSETIALLTRALVLLRAGDVAAAREGLHAVLVLDPMNPLARQRLAELDEQMAQSTAQTIDPARKIELGIPIHELVGKQIPPNDAFLLSRLAAGALTLQELIQICPLPEPEIHRIVSGYLANGVLKQS